MGFVTSSALVLLMEEALSKTTNVLPSPTSKIC